jgi:hypothetical protein
MDWVVKILGLLYASGSGTFIMKSITPNINWDATGSKTPIANIAQLMRLVVADFVTFIGRVEAHFSRGSGSGGHTLSMRFFALGGSEFLSVISHYILPLMDC